MFASSSVIGNHVDDTAMVHDVMPVRDRRRETEVLFDEQDGEALRLELGDRAADLLDDHRRQPFVGSSSKRSLAPVRRMRPIASICCSPPESFVPLASQPLLECGKSSKICGT
jgi:hypothetical protein